MSECEVVKNLFTSQDHYRISECDPNKENCASICNPEVQSCLDDYVPPQNNRLSKLEILSLIVPVVGGVTKLLAMAPLGGNPPEASSDKLIQEAIVFAKEGHFDVAMGLLDKASWQLEEAALAIMRSHSKGRGVGITESEVKKIQDLYERRVQVLSIMGKLCGDDKRVDYIMRRATLVSNILKDGDVRFVRLLISDALREERESWTSKMRKAEAAWFNGDWKEAVKLYTEAGYAYLEAASAAMNAADCMRCGEIPGRARPVYLIDAAENYKRSLRIVMGDSDWRSDPKKSEKISRTFVGWGEALVNHGFQICYPRDLFRKDMTLCLVGVSLRVWNAKGRVVREVRQRGKKQIVKKVEKVLLKGRDVAKVGR